MKPMAHFKIDPRLAALLGETYRSTEQALKELVDNAWDADNVWINLPVGTNIHISEPLPDSLHPYKYRQVIEYRPVLTFTST